MAGRPVGVAPFGNGGVMVVCDDGSTWYMAAPYGVWFRQMALPGVPAPTATAVASAAAQPAPPAAEPATEAGGWTKTPPFPIPDDIPAAKLPPGVAPTGG